MVTFLEQSGALYSWGPVDAQEEELKHASSQIKKVASAFKVKDLAFCPGGSGLLIANGKQVVFFILFRKGGSLPHESLRVVDAERKTTFVFTGNRRDT